MTDHTLSEEELWLRRLSKELKGKENQKMSTTIQEYLESHILPRIEEGFHSTDHVRSPLKTSERYSIAPTSLTELNALILSGLNRGVQSIMLEQTWDRALQETILNDIQTDIIKCWFAVEKFSRYSLYRDYASGLKCMGLEAKESENIIKTDADLLSDLITILDKQEDITLFHVNIALTDRFDLNIMRIDGMRSCLEHIKKAVGKDFKTSINTYFNIKANQDELENTLIRAAAQCLSSSLAGSDQFCLNFGPDYLDNPWPDKYLRSLRSIPLLLEHESELLSDRSISHGSHYMESLKKQYIESVWSNLQENLKNADSK